MPAALGEQSQCEGDHEGECSRHNVGFRVLRQLGPRAIQQQGQREKFFRVPIHHEGGKWIRGSGPG